MESAGVIIPLWMNRGTNNIGRLVVTTVKTMQHKAQRDKLPNPAGVKPAADN
jgi:hypothetical protein